MLISRKPHTTGCASTIINWKARAKIRFARAKSSPLSQPAGVPAYLRGNLRISWICTWILGYSVLPAVYERSRLVMEEGGMEGGYRRGPPWAFISLYWPFTEHVAGAQRSCGGSWHVSELEWIGRFAKSHLTISRHYFFCRLIWRNQRSYWCGKGEIFSFWLENWN